MRIEQTTKTVPHNVAVLNNVDYEKIADNLPLPLIWTMDRALGSWMPSYQDDTRSEPLDVAAGRMQLHNQGIIVLRGFFTRAQTTVLSDAFFKNPQYFARHAIYEGFNDLKRYVSHNAPMQRYYHMAISQFINSLLPVRVKPSYVFSSCYEKGSTLARHIDSRPACTWNVSVATNGSNPGLVNQWPLFIESHNQRHQIHLDIGDAVLYSGVNDYHWREQLPAYFDWMLGTVFHFAPFDYTGSLD